ncbi:UNVERIFIED_CONTAM: hypothetical protein Sangu_2600600 [Sesamum angustifolium]|uniref:Reverse transcriptase Ty1/copia-type domain-containing protein n=1 Tax=Sesamum angustifolium TaxID=2727405 RepID=A0AAW2J6A6_9LAMI
MVQFRKHGVNSTDTFAPMARMESIHIVLTISAQLGLPIYQLDVKSTFLNGGLEEEVYVEQPTGYIVQGKDEKVYRFKKSLYELKQAPRTWNSKIDGYFQANEFERSQSEPSLYVKKGSLISLTNTRPDIVFQLASYRDS